MAEIRFPPDFDWGAGSSAYQIEGAWDEDGKGPSVWDELTHGGFVAPGPNGDTACDFYHRYPEDIALMKDLGLKTVRFSVAWTRILPEGKGEINQKGIDFYNRLIDEFLKAGVSPLVNLYHFDHPLVFEQAGSWANHDMAKYFGEYASIVASAFGDRVKRWMLANEPMTFTGEVNIRWFKDWPKGLKNMHGIALAQGIAARAVRAATRPESVGVCYNTPGIYPASDSDEDLAAAEREWNFNNAFFIDGIQHGRYPECLLEKEDQAALGIEPGDMELVKAPLDFIGVNVYARRVIAADPAEPHMGLREVPPPADKESFYGMELYPEAMHQVLTRVWRDCKVPLWVTEVGCDYSDFPDENGIVNDDRRIKFLGENFGQIRRAMDDGVDVRGCHVWTVMDNVEWLDGFNKRFGLVYCDPTTQQRVVKKSGYWYRDIIKSNTLVPS
jgi:beta-glucosidase